MGDKPNGKIKGRSYWTGKQRTWADEGGYSSDADGGGNGSMRCLRRPCGPSESTSDSMPHARSACVRQCDAPASTRAFSLSVIPTASPAPVDHRNLVPTYEHPARKRAPFPAEGGAVAPWRRLRHEGMPGPCAKSPSGATRRTEIRKCGDKKGRAE